MKLSQLVAYLNHLETFRSHGAEQAMSQCIDPMLHVIRSHGFQVADIVPRLDQHRAELVTALSGIDSVVSDLKNQIKSNIESLEPHYLQESYKLYSEGMCHDSNQLMLERRTALTDEAENYLRARLLRHSDWHYPGMILRPGLENWIMDLVALDPMYLVDVNLEMLEPVRNMFNKEYQNRLRFHIISERTDSSMLHQLPQNQLGFVLAYNYFNFKPLELIRCFLEELYQCLRPGGTLIFTFNNCDRAGGVELAERYFMCYTPARLILPAAEMIGFQISHTYDIDAAATWVELVKPGQLQSMRGGQSLAKVVAKNNKKS